MSYNIEVLYEDNHLIAVVKPPGALVQADETEERSMMDDVKDYLKAKYQKPGNVFLGLIHRLDRNVTGIVVFAKTSKGASRLSEQFRKRDITKTYHALVEGHLERPHGTLINMLDKEEPGIRQSNFNTPSNPLPRFLSTVLGLWCRKNHPFPHLWKGFFLTFRF
jgi:23S rRNA pseudouridine1911/1915/1917 synthase